MRQRIKSIDEFQQSVILEDESGELFIVFASEITAIPYREKTITVQGSGEDAYAVVMGENGNFSTYNFLEYKIADNPREFEEIVCECINKYLDKMREHHEYNRSRRHRR